MGCCQSKLLNIQTPSNKYQAGPCFVQSDIKLLKKKMVPIQLAKPLQNQQCSSIFTLRYGLQKIVSIFQQQGGPITYNFIQKQPSMQATTKQIDQQKSPNQLHQTNSNQTVSKNNTQYKTQSSIGSEQSNQISQFYQNNTKILSYAEISSIKQLQKQLFYINSNQIANIQLLKWTEQARITKNIQFSKLVQFLKQSQSPFVYALIFVSLYEDRTKINLLSFKQLRNGIGMRLFINGTKRMIRIQQSNIHSLTATTIAQRLTHLTSLNKLSLSYCSHILTGWIPQVIKLTDFENTKQIFKRLVKNFNTNSLIIGFSNLKQQQFMLLKQIKQNQQSMILIHINTRQQIYGRQVNILWNNVTQMYPIVNILWNPFIYGFNKKIQAVTTSQQQGLYYKRKKPKFTIKIPPSKSQVQVRILVQIHQTTIPIQSQFQILLYQSDYKYIDFQRNHTPIRNTISTNPHYLSQIFIFQKSNEQNQYIFMLNFLQKKQEKQTDLQITVDVFAFFSIEAKLMKQPKLYDKFVKQQQFKYENAGFAMNSPNFNKNLIYSLNVPTQTLCKIYVKFNTIIPALFQIYVLPDNLNTKDLTFIKPNQLSKQVIQSEQFQKQGQLEFMAQKQNYIVIIVAFTPTIGTINFTVENYANNNQNINQIKKKIKVEPILFQAKFFREFNFGWEISSSGPRKRTKSNSDFIFYPIKIFNKFFENPFIDYYLSDGLYQFSVASKDFQQEFKNLNFQQDYTESFQKFYKAMPPSLSLAIFQLNQKKDKAKIILDDYQYVPYGIGFWTQPFQLQGLYRFVFPKMQQKRQEGFFRIRKLDESI